MYDDHYGLTGRPFQLTPDPGFWFDTATHRKAMAYLGYGLSQGEGFVVITGAPGVGKTTLMGHLLAEIDRERLNVIKIVSTQLRPEDLLRTVCTGLGIDASGLAKAEMLAEIEHGLHDTAREGRRTLLVMDEAQALPVESLEELRMLSNFQAGGYPLLQIFLLGQPEFRQTLNDPRLDQLRQRVIAMHHLGGMEPEEVESYLIHRLSCVGWRGKPRFTNDAIAAMYRWSSGVPRQLNQLAGRVLLYGSIEGIDSFSGRDVEAVIADLDEDSLASSAPGSVDRRRRPSIQGLANGLERREPLRRRSEEAAPSVTPIQTDPAPAPTPGEGPSDTLDRRIHDLEIQLRQQDEALRRILTLLVDWVESDTGQRPDLSSLRGFAA